MAARPPVRGWILASVLVLIAADLIPELLPLRPASQAAGGTVRRPAPTSGSMGEFIDIEPIPRLRSVQGTAFSVAGGNRWMTARHVINSCTSGQLLGALGDMDLTEMLVSQSDDVAIVRTDLTGAPPFHIAPRPPTIGEAAYLFGYPHGAADFVSMKLLGRAVARQGYRPYPRQPVLQWVETGGGGRADDLSGMSGGPAVNAQGQVVGVFSASGIRRGRIVTANPWSLARFDDIPAQSRETMSRAIKGQADAAIYLRQMIRARSLRELVCDT